MPHTLPDEHVRLLRLRAQGLVARRCRETSVAGVLQRTCGLQAQEGLAAALAVRARSSGLIASDLARAQFSERKVLRTWCMRGTLHLLAVSDVAWLLSLHGPAFIAKTRRRYEELGLDEATLRKGTELLEEALSIHRTLTRAEIVAHLAKGGIRLVGQAVYHLIRRAGLEGRVCFGPDRGGEPTYELLSRYVIRPCGLAREEALAELARRYLAAYGPASLEDFTSWSGLPTSALKEGWKRIDEEIAEVKIAGRQAVMLGRQQAWLNELVGNPVSVNLLPSYDGYLLGYKARTLAVAPKYEKRIHPGGGVFHPAITINGRVVGVWRLNTKKGRTKVLSDLFAELV